MMDESPADAPTVLVVDPEVIARHAIAQYLRECGFKVGEAASADEAMLVLRDETVIIDIVLLDLAAPGSTAGFALARWVRHHKPGLAVILVAGPAKAAKTAEELCETGPMLTKPYDHRALFDQIMRLLAERQSRQ